ncbi:endolytic transglycosylase MltG [Paenibacillus hamazuiensis]|uniref:endolytic transglycosylase MltG n=1 Tax=Paenibacillus hamazuiensis TaxID=2936508 RepID=UPI002010BC89|nr:endolytic transglycosylase MltG [Paenibacillus hamazuiensis]
MLKNKTLLYGLGSGLVLGAMLVQMMNAVTQAAPKGPIAPVTPAIDQLDAKQIKEIAAKYYQVFPKEERVYNQSQADALVQKRVEEEKAKLPASPPSQKIYIYVPSGFNSTQVADMLYQSGVITDRKSFEDEISKQKLTSKIQAGIHVFEGQTDIAQVLSNLTSK